MSLSGRWKREMRFLKGALRTLRRVKPIAPESRDLVCDTFEAAVDAHRARPAIAFEGRTVTYGELDAIANRYAHWAKEHKLRRGDVVAVFLPNRIEYLACWMGLTKVGVAGALINNQLTGQALCHCLDISGASHVITDAETTPVFEQARPHLARSMTVWTLGPAQGDLRDLAKALKSCSQLRPDRSVRDGLTARDTALFIYTSGTTGMPKAARIAHMRAQLYMLGFAGSTGAEEDDRIHVSLPLYHATGGLCAMGAALLNGGCVMLHKKFSVSRFWDEIAEGQCTMFVYIGELCRYLVNAPEHPAERATKVRLAFGNGLRPDVWEKMLARFPIERVLEFYGSTEGNVSLFNFDGRLGAVGRVPGYMRKRFPVKIVKFDVETEEPVRGPDGRCIEAAVNEPGECIGKIQNDGRSSYTGYTDKQASERKVLHDVFEAGDAWFRTGDLMREDADGYFYFVDRIGDTFRWKGENVSTSEVAERLAHAPGVEEAIVYGVKVGDADGRAGMAAIVPGEGFDIKALADYVDRELPTYSRPLFVRLRRHVETTGTFKYRKMDLVEQGFDPAATKDPIYFRNPSRGFVKVSKANYDKIVGGGFKL